VKNTERQATIDRRRELRRQLVAIRTELKAARADRKRALVDARERCRSERLAVKERSRALRMRVLRDLRDVTRAEHAQARRDCSERLRAARAIPDRSRRKHAELSAERRRETEARRLARAEHERKKAAPASTCLSCKPESDDEVRTNLTSDLLPLFDRVGSSIKGGPTESRTAAFLAYAAAHPEEVLATSAHEADTRVRELESAHREIAKSLGRAPNSYEAKKAARLERMRERAARLRSEANARETSARERASHIPFGQPILVGHHSEKRHRRDIERIHQGFGKAHELTKEAEAIEKRADRSERIGAISSDDPDVLEKLREKLAGVERDRERMATANRAVRSANPREALRAIGFSESLIEKALTPDPMGHIGFPPYALKNAAAEAARLRERIRLLEERAARPAPTTLYGYGVRIEEADNRVRIIFDAKPDVATRAALKGSGFRWSPNAGAWQRHASNAAWAEAKRITRVEAPMAPAATSPRLADVIPIRIAPTSTSTQPVESRTKGEGLDTVAIAKRVREDIAAAVRIGDLPKAKYSVRTDKYSMGSSITIEATRLPFPVLNRDAFHVVGNWVELDRMHFSNRFTLEAQHVDRMLNRIVTAYHWDRSDPMSDIYNERFHRDVRVTPRDGEWEAIEREKLAAAREEKPK
jgi:hypothetical protein